jgi:hypothetical protein
MNVMAPLIDHYVVKQISKKIKDLNNTKIKMRQRQ